MLKYHKGKAITDFREIKQAEFVWIETKYGRKVWQGDIYFGFPPNEVYEAMVKGRLFQIEYER